MLTNDLAENLLFFLDGNKHWPGEIARKRKASRTLVWRQFKKLEEMGLIIKEGKGQKALYKLGDKEKLRKELLKTPLVKLFLALRYF